MPFQICRVCYERGYNMLNLKDEVHDYERKLSSCIPEIDIYVIHNPGICHACADMLDIAFKFRSLCLENEKRYNSAFNDENKISNRPVSSNNINVTARSVDNVSMDYDRPDLLTVLKVKTESEIFCSICNEEFPSASDKDLHDSKLHPETQKVNIKNLPTTQVDNNLKDRTLTFIDCNAALTDTQGVQSNNTVPLKKPCHICKKTFEDEKELDDHVKLHFIKCCGESFSTAKLLQLHTYKEHNMTCGICNETFSQISILFNHVLDHVEVHWYKCDFCGKQFKTNKGLNEHNCQYYSCDVCGTVYFTKKSFNEHVQTHQEECARLGDATEDDWFVCEKCSTYYETETLLLDHISTEPNCKINYNPFSLQEKLFECCLCGKEFKLLIHFKTHIMQAHCNKVLTIPVLDCQKSNFYKNREYFRKHLNLLIKYSTQSKQRKFPVTKEKLHRNFIKFAQHLRGSTAHIATDKLMSRCMRICFVCNIMYTSITSFRAHIKTSHDSCCSQKIQSVDGFLRHNITHYNEPETMSGGAAEIMCLTCRSKHGSYTILLVHKCSDFRSSNRRYAAFKKGIMKKTKIRVKRRNYTSLKNKRKARKHVVEEEIDSTRCTIELHEIDPSDPYESVMWQRETAKPGKSICEICKEQFDYKSVLLDHIMMHI